MTVYFKVNMSGIIVDYYGTKIEAEQNGNDSYTFVSREVNESPETYLNKNINDVNEEQ